MRGDDQRTQQKTFQGADKDDACCRKGSFRVAARPGREGSPIGVTDRLTSCRRRPQAYRPTFRRRSNSDGRVARAETIVRIVRVHAILIRRRMEGRRRLHRLCVGRETSGSGRVGRHRLQPSHPSRLLLLETEGRKSSPGRRGGNDAGHCRCCDYELRMGTPPLCATKK